MLPSQYDSAAIAVSAIAIIGWVVRYVLKELTEAIRANTRVTQQTYEFLVTLNGDIKKVVTRRKRLQ